MSKETNDQNSSKSKDTPDLFQTIEFTAEDKRKLRHSNQQPLDQDYFAKSLESEMEDKEKQDERTHLQEPLSDEVEEKITNEFRYKSIRERQVTTDKKAENKEEIRPKRKKLFSDLFKPTYEERYDLNQLDDITSYNQFQGDEEEEEEKSESFFSAFTNPFKRTGHSSDKSEEDEIEEDYGDDVEPEEKKSLLSGVKEVFFGDSEDSDESNELKEEEELISEDEVEESEETEDAKAGEAEEAELTEVEDEVEEESDSEEIEDDSFDQDDIEEISEEISQQTASIPIPIQVDQHVDDSIEGIQLTDASLNEEDSSKDDKDKLVKGASWLTAGSIISRIVGALYVIPWATWLGTSYSQANSLYSIGYKPYSLFLAIATAGFPSSIAKQMAFYHSKKEYKVADKLFKNSLIIMLLTGVLSAGLLFLIAPFLASQSATTNVAGATLVIRSLSPALLILPLMSLLRGYFQGFNDMKPTAVSQIIEQFARVGYLLAATYAIMMIYNGEVTHAVVQSTFAAFIGALASLVYLVIIYIRHLPLIKGLIRTSANKIDVDFKESIKIMVVDSIPFIILGSGIIIMQLVDTYTFKQILVRTSSLLLSEIEQLYGTLSLDVDKLIMIIISLAVALASSLVPVLTSYFAKRDIKGTSSLVEHIVILFSFIMLPAALGMAAISNNIYFLFYPYGLEIGPSLLITGSIASIVLGLYTVLSTILQSMNFRRLAVRFLLIGILVKLILQFPAIALFQAHGALISTMLGLLVSSIFMWFKINRELEINYKVLNVSLIKISVGAILMWISATMWNQSLNLLFGDVGRFLTFVKILLVVLMAVLVYGSIMGLTNMLSVILGDKNKDLQDKMRIM